MLSFSNLVGNFSNISISNSKEASHIIMGKMMTYSRVSKINIVMKMKNIVDINFDLNI